MRRVLGGFILLGLHRIQSGWGMAVERKLPAAVRRRKSPALWRDDLLPADMGEKGRSKKRIPVRPEVMSPAGGWPQLKAAVGNGADAVYLGLNAFSARARASNFHVENDLPGAVDFCHQAGVKVYVALNTLVFDSELEEVSQLIQLANRAGVDALIVQDLGVAKLARRVAPTLAIHSSTQQTVTSADGVAFCKDQHDSERVVLGRELSISEMTQVTSESDVEVEVFVHGALCVSYSGQCFSSEAWGGRSANRGQCAQACRLPYGLIVNGCLEDLFDMKYLLSPQDLCGINHVPALVQAGISCLKIEGRLKDEAYVAATTRAYRNAVDRAWKELTNKDPPRHLTPEQVTPKELAQLFSRGQDDAHPGLTVGFMDGTKHQVLVRGRSPRHRGIHVGKVVSSSAKRGLIVMNNTDLKLGDGIVIDRGLAEEDELGGPIFGLESLSEDKVLIRFGREVMKKWKEADDLAAKGLGSRFVFAPRGAHVWRTADAVVEKKMRRLSEAVPPRPAIQVKVYGKIGYPLKVAITDGTTTAYGLTDKAMVLGESSGLGHAKVEKAIGTLGNTRWALGGAIDTSELDSRAWCPISWVKEARRRAVENWELLNHVKSDGGCSGTEVIHKGVPDAMMRDSRLRTANPNTETKLSVLARSMEQVESVCQMVEDGASIDEVIVDFLEVDGMRDAVSMIQEAGMDAVVASPRIIKPGEMGIWRTLLRLRPDGLLVRSAGLLYKMKSLGGAGATVNVGVETEDHVEIPPLYGDFSLNAANALTALELLSSGLNRITTGFDLNANAITQLATLLGSKAQNLETIVHAKLPIFHTEHCVFARFLSKGNSYLDCGHVCTRNRVHLRDQTGSDNLVLADMGCRNTVFSSQSQSGVHSMKEWKQAGIGRMRVELVDEDYEDTKTIVGGYLGVLEGYKRPGIVWNDLRQVKDSNGRQGGVSLGSFHNRAERRAGEL